MRKTNIADMGNLLWYAVDLGYNWNVACKILDKDDIYMGTYYLEELDQRGWSEDSIRIVRGFMEKHNVDEFTLTGK